jgi:hypothetical protein
MGVIARSDNLREESPMKNLGEQAKRPINKNPIVLTLLILSIGCETGRVISETQAAPHCEGFELRWLIGPEPSAYGVSASGQLKRAAGCETAWMQGDSEWLAVDRWGLRTAEPAIARVSPPLALFPLFEWLPPSTADTDGFEAFVRTRLRELGGTHAKLEPKTFVYFLADSTNEAAHRCAAQGDGRWLVACLDNSGTWQDATGDELDQVSDTVGVLDLNRDGRPELVVWEGSRTIVLSPDENWKWREVEAADGTFVRSRAPSSCYGMMLQSPERCARPTTAP